MEKYPSNNIEDGEKSVEKKIDYAPQTEYYDFNPNLTLREKDSDVSYRYAGIHRQRNMDLYEDNHGDEWFGVKKSPRQQMAVSLLAQPFFHISTITQIPEQESAFQKVAVKINPTFAAVMKSIAAPFKGEPRFVSKKLNLEKVPEREFGQVIAEYTTFCFLFEDCAIPDRDIMGRHNVRRDDSTYALFDFQSVLVPFKHVDKEKLKNIVEGGLSNVRRIFSSRTVPFSVLTTVVEKLKEVQQFLGSKDGQAFFEAVFKKTDYVGEFKKEHAKSRWFDESYSDVDELYRGLLARIDMSLECIVEDLQKFKKEYLVAIQDMYKADPYFTEQQALEEFGVIVADVMRKKPKEHHDSEAYEKKVQLRPLTLLKNKINKGLELSEDDLLFLYEINTPIKGFGAEHDEIVRELREKRDLEHDLPIIFKCLPEQIAYTSDEINENTKFYIGEVNEEIFQKLPAGLEHWYTHFPERQVIEKINLGGKTREELLGELKQGRNVPSRTEDMLRSNDFVVNADIEGVTLVQVTAAELGFTENATLDKIYERAGELGLQLCPAEVGPYYFLKNQNRLLQGTIFIAMKAISIPGGNPRIFNVKGADHGLSLDSLTIERDWYPEYKFVFRFPKTKI